MTHIHLPYNQKFSRDTDFRYIHECFGITKINSRENLCLKRCIINWFICHISSYCRCVIVHFSLLYVSWAWSHDKINQNFNTEGPKHMFIFICNLGIAKNCTRENKDTLFDYKIAKFDTRENFWLYGNSSQ